VHFVFVGPKTYAYKTNDGAAVVKMKGFTLNGQTEKTVTFDSMLQLLSCADSPPLVVSYPNSLQRVKRAFEIHQQDMSKRLKVTYDKRRVVGSDWSTLPFGFCDM
jgi:hypothetical protein